MTDSAPHARPAVARLPSLRARILRAVAVLAITLVVVSALTVVALRQLGGAIGAILRENYVSVVACMEMNEALERQDSAAIFAASGHEEIARPVFEGRRADFARAFAAERANITLPGEAELIADVDALYRDYLASVDRNLAAPREVRVEGYFRELLPRFQSVKEKVEAIRVLNQRNMEAADVKARAIAQRTLEIAVVVTLIALALGAWLLRSIPKAVLDPIAALTRHAAAIGEGKLDEKVPAAEVLELKTLVDAMSRMQEKLRAYRESSLGELLAAKDLSNATVASMTDPVLVFGAHGDLVLSNAAAESIFGLSPGDDDELRAAGIEIPDPIATARDLVLARREPHLPQSLADAMRWVTPEGERYFLVRASPLRTDDSEPAGALVIAQDVTRFRRIDALKSDVVATVSHELKTPLTSLRLATHMLLDDEAAGALSAMQRELATTARDETERLQSTVDELLDLVRIEREAGALHRVPVDPAAIVAEVANAHRTVSEARSIHLEVAVDPGHVVELDPDQIAVVLGNLVSNAIRHSRDGARVWLEGRGRDDAFVFVVRDEGEGIDPAHLDRIFDRHWSGAEPATLKGRHGLGLAIAKDIAMRHGGSLEAESELGKGSVFRLSLPSHRPPSSR